MFRKTAIVAAVAATTIATWSSSQSAFAGDGDDVVEYVVKKGDTCVRIAKRELGSRRAYRLIHKSNPKLGKLPHRLVPGSILLLPKVTQVPDAHVTEKQGKVRVRKPAAADWLAASKGMPLFRSWRVNSQEESSAELTFADNSAIYLRENTVVVVYGPSSKRAKKASTYASLESGTLRTRLGELDRKRPMIVETPGSETALASGSAVVSVDGSGTSRIANHGGSDVMVRSRGKRSRAVSVAVGMGSKVERDKRPEKPRPLPPTPVWEPGVRHVVGTLPTGGTLRGTWKPVDEAENYRVEIAIDPIARAVVAHVIVPKSITQFEARGLPEGTYYASVSAIDNDKFESIPSPREMMKISMIKIQGGAEGTTGSPLRIVRGSIVESGDGVSCHQGEGEPAQATTIISEKPLHCFLNTNKEEIPAPALEVVPLTASVFGATSIGRESSIPLTLELKAGGLAIPVVAVQSEGVVIEKFEQKDDKLELVVRAGQDAPPSATVEVVSVTDKAVLTTVTVDIEAPPPQEKPPEPTPIVWRPHLELGITAGLAQGDDTFAIAGGLETRISLGLRVGYRIIDRLAIELEGIYSEATPQKLGGKLNVFALRPQLRGDILVGKIVRLHATAGGYGLLGSTDDSSTLLGGSYGIGVRMLSGNRTELRADVRHSILSAQGKSGAASQLDAMFGLGFLF